MLELFFSVIMNLFAPRGKMDVAVGRRPTAQQSWAKMFFKDKKKKSEKRRNRTSSETTCKVCGTRLRKRVETASSGQRKQPL
jgi:hypothetical protein